YYTDAELPGRQNIDGEDLTFFDYPRRYNNVDGTKWNGELSVVVDQGKGYETVVSISYGFEIKDGKAVANEIEVKDSSFYFNKTGEAYFQGKTINEYNKTQYGRR